MVDRQSSNSLQCRFCFEDYQIHHRIWQCQCGHSVCASCRNHLHQCPFCMAPYAGTRNYDIEDLVNELISNSFRADGDKDNVPSTAEEEDKNSISPDEHRQIQLPSSNENDHTESSPAVDCGEVSDAAVVECRPKLRRRNYSNPWMNCNSDGLSTNQMVGGRDHGGTPLYVGSAVHGVGSSRIPIRTSNKTRDWHSERL